MTTITDLARTARDCTNPTIAAEAQKELIDRLLADESGLAATSPAVVQKDQEGWPLCPGCKTPMQHSIGRDRRGLYVNGYGCFNCEFWDVPFLNGRIYPHEHPDFYMGKPTDLPLGPPVRFPSMED